VQHADDFDNVSLDGSVEDRKAGRAHRRFEAAVSAVPDAEVAQAGETFASVRCGPPLRIRCDPAQRRGQEAARRKPHTNPSNGTRSMAISASGMHRSMGQCGSGSSGLAGMRMVHCHRSRTRRWAEKKKSLCFADAKFRGGMRASSLHQEL
jgi:hypothetical protein